MNIAGTVRHLYSPRLNFEVSTSSHGPVGSLSYPVRVAFHSAPGAACVDLQSELHGRGEHDSSPDPHHRLAVIYREECDSTMLVDVLAKALSEFGYTRRANPRRVVSLALALGECSFSEKI